MYVFTHLLRAQIDFAIVLLCKYHDHMSSINEIIYTVNHKKRDILFLTITMADLNRLL